MCIRLCHQLQLRVKLPCLLMTGPVSPPSSYTECRGDNGDFSHFTAMIFMHNEVINTIISGHY